MTLLKSEMTQKLFWRAGLLLWMCAMTRVQGAELSIKQCVILEYTSITCYWEASNLTLGSSSYRLQVNKTDCDTKEGFIPVDVCHSKGSNCSVQPIDSAFHCFYADVLVSTPAGPIRSPPFFFIGIYEVKLHPPQITGIGPSARQPGCLEVAWGKTDILTKEEKSYRWLQMEYTTHDQTQSQTIQAYSNETLELCNLYAGSWYTVKLRAQDSRSSAHWSSWAFEDIRTEEKAPSAAPQFWRHIQPSEKAGKRHVTLLWKPLSWPVANGDVLSYTVSCCNEVDSSQWTCGTLDSSKTSCVLIVSFSHCYCSLTAANSAGTSPPAHLYIPGHTDAELPAPQSVSVTLLDDTRLKVEWTAPMNQSETGFVLQWISIPHNRMNHLHFEHLDETARSFIITGLLPEVPYNLSVIILYKERTGNEIYDIAFTREGAPSVGPKLTVLQTSRRSITLRWDPVPIEKLHGFLQYYTVMYSINGKVKREQVGGSVEQISLSGLMEGIYNICVIAHTVEGDAAGPWQMVAVGHDDIEVIPILLCALLLSFIILIVPVCMRVRIKHYLCPTVPDPSKSSLLAWSNIKPCQPRLTSSPFITVSQTSGYHSYDKNEYIPVEVLSYHTDQPLNNDNEPPKSYNTSLVTTYMVPSPLVGQQRTEEPTQAFSVHFINQSYIRPDQVTSAGYQVDQQPSMTNLLFDTVFAYRSNQMCEYVQVSQSYIPDVEAVDGYRTLNSDECSHFLQSLPEDHNT
ncbi:interleukin-6 receptor subunit beta-like [Myxocyprinus asiaticus]|uniref:interleukin-6 receptor subunit beta-like n=1 Tax=Myxocyprinus asiaticus TaxID=70543 RepID=UPI0022219FC4|nr:interleukin-6 receptor subunit beta-like [Myxocyprinus asiaticus]XP_051556901.1 interleukin-6 receptor subunit beta-like [Myxocyprinus asiaticus]